MICSRCGKPLQAGASFCVTCNAPGIAPMRTPSSAWGSPPPLSAWGAPPAAAVATEPAGFWLRFLAYFIDSFVAGIAGGVASGVVGAVVGVASGASGSEATGPAAVLGVVAAFAAYWIYFAAMESSGKQATLGKMALGLTVTDLEGRRIGFGRASGRWFSKLISWVPLGIGFLAAGFTQRKQGFHDMIAGTLVMRRGGKSGTGAIVAIVLAVLVFGTAVVGILAAIAIPNFLRYQLRSKQGEAKVLVTTLYKAEMAHERRTRRFVPLELPANGTPGSAKMVWSADDLVAANAIDWLVEGGTYFTYRVAVETTEDGREAFTICAESDIDGDGKYAAFVLWQPTINQAGRPASAPPPAPCAHDPELDGRTLSFGPDDPMGQPVKVSPDDVF
jgi:uncharacterized RDD family membrane protein YckC